MRVVVGGKEEGGREEEDGREGRTGATRRASDGGDDDGGCRVRLRRFGTAPAAKAADALADTPIAGSIAERALLDGNAARIFESGVERRAERVTMPEDKMQRLLTKKKKKMGKKQRRPTEGSKKKNLLSL